MFSNPADFNDLVLAVKRGSSRINRPSQLGLDDPLSVTFIGQERGKLPFQLGTGATFAQDAGDTFEHCPGDLPRPLVTERVEQVCKQLAGQLPAQTEDLCGSGLTDPPAFRPDLL